MTAAETDTSTITNALVERKIREAVALDLILLLISETRWIYRVTQVQSDVHEYQILADNWNHAIELFENEGHGWNDDPSEENPVVKIDNVEYYESQRPVKNGRFKQVKIGYQYFDLENVEREPIYYFCSNYSVKSALIESLGEEAYHSYFTQLKGMA